MKPIAAVFVMVASLVACGCNGPAIRSQSPEDSAVPVSNVKLVGDMAAPFGTYTQKVEGIALVVGLPGTGEDPPLSPQRAVLLHDMQSRGVESPQQILASPNTAMVMVRGFLKPGIQKGDHFDIEVRVASNSAVTSLRGGRMLPARLTELAVINNQVHDGHLLGTAQGPIMVDPGAEGDEDRIVLGRGRILGGGTALQSRSLGLVLKPESQNLRMSSMLGVAINRRFHTFVGGVKTEVARPKTDEYIELAVHPRYKDNIPRYMQVVRGIAIRETSSQRMARLDLLERQLLDPITSATAAVRLEAIGRNGVDILKKGLASSDPEVRFYAAEALAYLDESECVPVLIEAARDERAFRIFSLTALSAMDDYAAYEGLRGLLDVPSAETRYGAFRALWAMNPHDRLVRGEQMNDEFSYHVLESTGPPMIHVTRSFRPEVVVFGHDQQLNPPFLLDAGKQILVTGEQDGVVTVSRFAVDAVDQKRVVDARLDSVMRAVAELGGTYPDVVQLLEEAKQKGVLPGRFAVDALPQVNRAYYRSTGDQAADAAPVTVANPLPGLFPRLNTRSSRDEGSPGPAVDEIEGTEEKPGRVKAFFGRMVGFGNG